MTLASPLAQIIDSICSCYIILEMVKEIDVFMEVCSRCHFGKGLKMNHCRVCIAVCKLRFDLLEYRK